MRFKEMKTMDNNNNQNICIEKIFCYETKNFYYIIGSSSCKNKHRILKIDRRNKLKLDIECCNNNSVMNTNEMLQYLHEQSIIDTGKRIEPTVAFGLVGFVRFLEGYYMILIIKRRCIAMIGIHCIYKIEDTLMIYIPNEEKSNGSADEQRYLRIFNNVDLKSNFYFSYSYDLSNTLQYNLCSPNSNPIINSASWGLGTQQTVWDVNNNNNNNTNNHDQTSSYDDRCIYIKPNMKFVWNEYLLSPMNMVHNDFYLYICHGFIGQAMLPFEGRNLIITLIARRSKKYAGTRFLKRGINCEGFVANEVETEQIVHDGNVSSFRNGLFSSFVQLRGSVPVFWSQHSAKMTPKPAINIDINDPFFEAAGKHFNNLLMDYGSPIIVVNLVKRKEKQESILHNQFDNSIEYLNQFLPKHHNIMIIGYDMAKSKKQDDNVINCLTKISNFTLRKTGFFINRRVASNCLINSSIQTGVVRVNCVDCLDRTNTAQCIIGMVAIGHQLHSMGVFDKTELEPDTELVKLLEELYEDHGDTLALQYGGSQLVHRIKTYRKGAPITSRSKDIMQSLSRYYSNAFSDWDKQTAINLFLGIYDTNRHDLPFIWNLNSDYELHNDFFKTNNFSEHKQINHDYSNYSHSHSSLLKHNASLASTSMAENRLRFTKWWSDRIAFCLPRSAKELFKYTKEGMSQRDLQFVKQINRYDWFFDLHRLQENILFVEMFLFDMKKSKYYGHYKRKLSSFRQQNRHSLVGIPIIMRSSTNDIDSDTDEDSDDDSSNNIIVRFENDSNSIPFDHVEEANYYNDRDQSFNSRTNNNNNDNINDNQSKQQQQQQQNHNHLNDFKNSNHYSLYKLLSLKNNHKTYEQLMNRLVKSDRYYENPSANTANVFDYENYLKKFRNKLDQNNNDSIKLNKNRQEYEKYFKSNTDNINQLIIDNKLLWISSSTSSSSSSPGDQNYNNNNNNIHDYHNNQYQFDNHYLKISSSS